MEAIAVVNLLYLIFVCPKGNGDCPVNAIISPAYLLRNPRNLREIFLPDANNSFYSLYNFYLIKKLASLILKSFLLRFYYRNQ